MVTWHKLEAATFCDLVTEFLSLHPMLNKPDDKETDVEEEEPASKKRKSPEVGTNNETALFSYAIFNLHR